MQTVDRDPSKVMGEVVEVAGTRRHQEQHSCHTGQDPPAPRVLSG